MNLVADYTLDLRGGQPPGLTFKLVKRVVVIETVCPGSPAEKAGLRADMLLRQAAGERILSVAQAEKIISEAHNGVVTVKAGRCAPRHRPSVALPFGAASTDAAAATALPESTPSTPVASPARAAVQPQRKRHRTSEGSPMEVDAASHRPLSESTGAAPPPGHPIAGASTGGAASTAAAVPGVARVFCPVQGCPRACPLTSPGWASLNTMKPHLQEHISGRERGALPADFLHHHKLDLCKRCGALITQRCNGACPSCWPMLRAPFRQVRYHLLRRSSHARLRR